MTENMKPKTRAERNRRLRLWIDELLSGRWRQAAGALRNLGDGRCCLGVACEVFMRETGEGAWVDHHRFLGQTDTLPPEVASWLDVRYDPILSDATGSSDNATAWNDEVQSTFEQIAEMIRRTFRLRKR